MIKQKTLLEYSAVEFKRSLDTAIQMGWLVQSVAVDSETGYWIGILYREAA